MKEIQRDGRTGELVIQKLRHVEPDDGWPASRGATRVPGLSNTQA